jgi:fusion and transport protein UGO1
MFSDLDYSDYISDSSPSAMNMIKEMADQALWKYTSVLIAQPFEVAKMVLQVRIAPQRDGLDVAGTSRTWRQRTSDYDDDLYDDVSGVCPRAISVVFC